MAAREARRMWRREKEKCVRGEPGVRAREERGCGSEPVIAAIEERSEKGVAAREERGCGGEPGVATREERKV